MKHRVAALSALFAIFLFLLPSSTPKANAAVTELPWFMDDPNSFRQVLEDAYANKKVQMQGYSFANTLYPMLSIGIMGIGAPGITDAGSPLSFQRSALGGITNYIVAMYANPPADTYAFVQDMGQNLGFIPKQAYAQGVGFSGLAPLLGLWKAFRNIAYILLALVMIIIGFLVMFRKKIDPKTVVTVQNALPGIVVILLLITFSYAIVGLLIDVMYLVILLALAVIGSSGIQGVNTAQLQTAYTTGGLGQLASGVFSPLSIFGTGGALAGIGTALGIGLAFTGVGAPLGLLVAAISYIGGLATSPGGPLSPLLFIIFALALIFGFIRIFFMLITAYIQIIMAVVLGPIQILLGALPGSNGVSAWFNNLIVNLITFPITIIMLAIGGVIAQNIGSQPLWVPPLLPGWASADLVRAIIGLGLVMTIPGVVNGVKESLKAKPAIGAGPGGILGPAVSGVTQIWQLGYQARMMGIWKGFQGKQEPGTGGGPKNK